MIKNSAKAHIHILEDYRDLCEEVVRQILSVSEKAISSGGRFSLVLSGGSTPQGVYALMASPFYRDRFQWQKIHFFLSDERWVPPDDTRSNYRMVYESLVSKVNIPSGNIHPIPTKNGDPKSSALFYEEMLLTFFSLKKGEWPHFDMILLGLGLDGHVASIFPQNPALSEKNRMVMAVSQKGIDEQRITLTLPVINHAEKIFILVSGEKKADIVHQVFNGETDTLLPAQKIRMSDGKPWWFLDRSCASKSINISDIQEKTDK